MPRWLDAWIDYCKSEALKACASAIHAALQSTAVVTAATNNYITDKNYQMLLANMPSDDHTRKAHICNKVN